MKSPKEQRVAVRDNRKDDFSKHTLRYKRPIEIKVDNEKLNQENAIPQVV